VLQQIKAIVEQKPDGTLKEMQQLFEVHGLSLSISSIFNALNKLGITLKKCHTELDRINSTTTIASRQAYATYFISNAPNNMEKCIFIDKSGFNLVHRNFARSIRGSRTIVILLTVRGRMVSLVAPMNA